jgi:predicted HTH transcriptional regulator
VLRQLSDWDAAYLNEVEAMDETRLMEKKQSDGLKPDEIAKQVCAFAIAGGGFVVFGIKARKDRGGFDQGAPTQQSSQARPGNQDTKAWIEALILTLHEPPITGCAARLLPKPNHHA